KKSKKDKKKKKALAAAEAEVEDTPAERAPEPTETLPEQVQVPETSEDPIPAVEEAEDEVEWDAPKKSKSDKKKNRKALLAAESEVEQDKPAEVTRELTEIPPEEIQ